MDSDQTLSEFIQFLNGDGGFQDALVEDKVAEAAVGVADDERMRIFNDLMDRKDEIRDPTAYVTHAFRKASGAVTKSSTNRSRAAGSPYLPTMAGMLGLDTSKVHKRITWLNGTGGFEGAICFDSVMKAAQGHSTSSVLEKLKQLEAKKTDVTEPTSWVTHALRKSPGIGQQQFMVQQMPFFNPMMAQHGALDVDKLRKRIGWLNNQGGLDNQLVYDKVMEAAAGVDTTSALKILKDCEEKKADVKDVTAYVTSALRKNASKHGGIGCMNASLAAPAMARTLQFMAASAPTGGDDLDMRLRKKVGYLNKHAGFNNTINYQEVKEAARCVSLGDALKCFDDLQNRQALVKDPTAYVCNALRKAGKGLAPSAARSGPVKAMRTSTPAGVRKSINKRKPSMMPHLMF